MNYLLVFLGGGIGASLRHAQDVLSHGPHKCEPVFRKDLPKQEVDPDSIIAL